MEVVLKVICFLVFLFIQFQRCLGNNNVIHVKNCLNKSVAQTEGWSRSIRFDMLAFTTEDVDLKLKWEIYKIVGRNIHKVNIRSKYSRGYNFVLEPYSLNEGFYKIVVFAIQKSYKMEHECFLRIRPEPCFAFIVGGPLLEYRPAETIIISGSISKDYCYPEGKKNSLEYTWSCTQKNNNRFCPYRTSGTDNKFVIPKEFVIDGEEFTITLTVENEDLMKSKAIQKILIKKDIAQYQIKCIHNCPPWSTIISPTVLSVNCTKYCGDPCMSSWNLYRSGEIAYRFDDRGTCKTKYLCTYQIMTPGKVDFVYRCKGKTIEGRAVMTINFKDHPTLTCNVDPKEGNSYTTKFKVSCQFNSMEIIQTIEVYLFAEILGDFITTWSPPKDHKFRLPVNTEQILVKVLVHPGVYTYTILNVTVKNELPLNNTKKAMARIFDLYKGSRDNSITSYLERDKQEALSMISNLWNEISIIERPQSKQFEKFLHNLKLHTMDDLLTIPIETGDSLIQLNNAIMNMLLSHNISDPLMGKSLTMVCKKLANDYEYLMKAGNDLYFRSTAGNIGLTKTLADCSSKIIYEDDDLLKAKENIYEKQHTTEKKLIFDTIKEDYDDYIDFDNEYYTYLEDLEETGSNILEITSALTKAVAESIGKFGHRAFVSEGINVSVYQKSGPYFRKKLGTQGVLLFPSRDIYRSKSLFSFTLLSWKRNIFWWTQTKLKPDTFIADISVRNMYTGRSVSDFRSPSFIFFDVVNAPPTPRYRTFSVTVPAIYHKQEENEGYMDSFINIHRLDVFRHQGVFVQFDNLRGQKFLIVIKNFKMPVMEDFKRRGVIIIAENNTYSSRENNNDYDSWYYIGVLPHRDMVKSYNGDQTFEYHVRFAAPACYEFTFDQSWKRTCMGGKSTTTHIICKCRHFSILAGKIEPVKSKKLTFVYTELELKVESHRSIFWCVLILFCGFCLCMLFGKQKYEIYYAADNNYNDKYAYLVVVRTGRFRQLTSRIVIKIIGTTGQTPPHILNYPDPHHRIFQGGSEDWIVITTAESLGDIQNIELRHDNYGLKPTWYCKDIVIHDIQTEEKWLFKINQTLSVCHEYRIRVAPMGTSRREFRKLWDILNLSADHQSWNIFVDDIRHSTPFINRLSMVYSKLITLFLIITVWHGFPVMQNVDAVDPYDTYFDSYLFLISFGSSLTSFLVHTFQVWWKPQYTIYFTVPLIVISNTLLIIFGFWIPFYSGIRIILAWIVGILLDIVIYNNLLGIVRKLIYGVKLLDTSKGMSYADIKKEIEIQKETLHRIFESTLIFKLHQMAIPLRGKKFRQRKREEIRRTKLGQQFKDLVMFGIYIILLYAVVSIEKDHLVFRDQNVIKDLFSGMLTRTKHLYETHYITDIYNYLNSTVIEAMHSPEWYLDYVDDEPGMLLDRSNKYIGVARIRQHRVISEECDIDFIPENIICGKEFSSISEDRRTFEDGWDHPTTYISVKKRMSSMWIYSYAATTFSADYEGDDDNTITKTITLISILFHLVFYSISIMSGLFSNYPGSGYVVNLGRTRYNSLANFKVIKESNWIDRFTRSIFIEFLTYSANCNLFNSVRIVIERSPTGLINSRVEVSPARMIYVGGELERTSLLISIAFVLWLAFLFLNKTKLILREKLTYLKNFWSLLDLTIIIISMCSIIIFIARIKSIGRLLNTIEKVKHNEFVNYFDLFHMHTTLNVIGVVLICISTVRLWKLMRFFKMFRMFEKTFVMVIGPVLALFLHHIIFILTCTMINHILLGENLEDFVNFKSSFKALSSIYLSIYDNYNIFLDHNISRLEMTVIVMYIVVSQIFFYIYIAICVMAHMDARKLFAQHQEEAYSFIDYLKEELMFLFAWFKLRVARHKEPTLKKQVIYPKPDRYLYANCISTTTHSMDAMAIVTAVVLYNTIHSHNRDGTLDEKQIELMLRVCHCFLSEHVSKDHKEIFFKFHKGKTLKIIDSKKIDKAKQVVELMLGVSAKLEKRQKLNRRIVLRHNLRGLDKVQKKLEGCLQSLENIEFDELNF